ncbi:MAG: DUF4391 domain-containing protein [Pseudomonadota bacterium]|nr:DUF4391 domain-containing protein [Pseudomonadota bacterium]
MESELNTSPISETNIEALYQAMKLPESSLLNSKIAKKQLLENAQLTASNKKAIQEDIDSVIWSHTLKTSTVNIAPFQDSISTDDSDFDLDYSEIAILRVVVRNKARINKINEVLHRAIPYPLLIVFTDNSNSSLLLSLATKRISKADHSKLTVERFYHTDWFSDEIMPNETNHFFSSLAVNKQSFVNFYEFYMGWVAQFIELEKSKYIGAFLEKNESTVDIQKAKVQAELLDKIALLESKLSGIKQKIKKEDQINRKVELNIQAQSIKTDLEMLKNKLKN